ncbi:glycerol-3-phosphate dehydrogenase/oxidase [Microbacterium testaceum]|uniref:glycerol-3-phosphate dehydrogenase/oxidase n=1 Tax=Microbacterium testaceum TaxID=2033 RepID=UPI003418E910
MSSPATSLRADVQALRDAEDIDVLIIGGGINGLATLRDLSLQGVSVALVERGDFVSGASSASSHMVHGGIRYLENGEFRLVKEAVTERNDLLKTAPHYVKPLETTIPIYKTFSGILSAPFRLLVTHGRGKPNERGALLIKVGLIMYDTFSRDGGSVPRHKFLGKKKSLAELPKLNPDLAYTATYFDASMHDPERIALDVLHDGIVAGAGRTQAVNYVSAVGADANGVRVRDEVSGEEFWVKAKVILNTAGPWTDLANAAMGLKTQFMGGTKGSHIVLDNPELLAATGGREIFFEHSDGRIVLIYPLKDRVLVGTTDIDADPSKPVVCTDDEIDYFFDLVGHVFPSIAVDRSQIVYTFSGIRPLPRHDDTAPGFVSRDYRIVEDEIAGVPAMSLVGGKWTTFRALAEHLSMKTLQKLRRPHRVSTQGLPIGGGAGFPATPEARRRWVAARTNAHSRELVEALLTRYGTRADLLLEALPAEPTPIEHAPGYYVEELEWIARNEQVVHLIDVLLRRTHLAFVGGMTERTLVEVAEAVAGPLGWDTDRVQEEVERTRDILLTAHRVDLAEAGVAAI